MSSVRSLLVVSLFTCVVATMRIDAPTADAAPSPCHPAPTAPAVTEGRSLPGTVGPSIGTLRAVMLLVHASDARPDESVAAPEQLFDAAEEWFRAVSYGRLSLRVDTVPRWLALPRSSAEYLADPRAYLTHAVAAADPYVDFSAVDVVYLAPSSTTPQTASFALLNGFGVRADGREVRLWIPFGAGFASSTGEAESLLHETGHLLGLPDLYVRNLNASFHRWDVMAARWPSELLAWHRWKLGWLDESQIVCVTRRSTRSATLAPVERPGGTKAIFVKRGNRVLAIEVRARAGYDRALCQTGVLVYEVDQTPFSKRPVRVYAAQADRRAPARDCGGTWNAPFALGRREVSKLRLTVWGVELELLAKFPDGSYRVRVTNRVA